MKIVVDSMPDSPSDCLFCDDVFKETCYISNSLCLLNSDQDKIYCPYLIELQVKK